MRMITHHQHRRRNSLTPRDRDGKRRRSKPREYTDEERQAAALIQAVWQKHRAGGWSVALLRKAIRIAKRRSQMRARIREVLLYAVFLFCFTAATISDFHDQDSFHFQNNVRGQFTRVEFLERHSPSWGKAMNDVATVQEWYQWLEGPFLAAAYSASTFDGDEDWTVADPGNILGYGRLVGGVRVGQLRVKRQACEHRLAGSWRFAGDNSTVYCYGTESGEWDASVEDRADFGSGARPFTYEGWNRSLTLPSVADERARSYTYERTTFMNVYPAPAFSVMLPQQGLANATAVVRALIDGNYVDLHTRAVFVDLCVYNVMLNRYLSIRIIMEVTKAGGVLPSYDAKLVPPSPFPFTHTASGGKMFAAALVIAFYAYYILHEVRALRRLGLAYFRSLETWFHDLNLFFYVVVWALRLAAYSVLPDAVVVDSDAFVLVRPYAELYTLGRYVNACNAFLCWFKIIKYLSLAPQFALVTGTLAESAAEVSGFLIIFMIITYGFATAFMMTFGASLSGYRNMSATVASLIKSLLGEFDFDELVEAQWVMGPLLFVVFVAVAVFVILNLLIAIISDAYNSVKLQLDSQENIQLGSEILEYVLFRLNQMPIVGAIMRRLDNRRRYLQQQLEKQLQASGKILPRRMSAGRLAGVGSSAHDLEEGGDDDDAAAAAAPEADAPGVAVNMPTPSAPGSRRVTGIAAMAGLAGAAAGGPAAVARAKKVDKMLVTINASTTNLLSRLEEIQFALDVLQGGSGGGSFGAGRRGSTDSVGSDHQLYTIYNADGSPQTSPGGSPVRSPTNANANANAKQKKQLNRPAPVDIFAPATALPPGAASTPSPHAAGGGPPSPGTRVSPLTPESTRSIALHSAMPPLRAQQQAHGRPPGLR